MENDQEKPTVSSPTYTALLCDDMDTEKVYEAFLFAYSVPLPLWMVLFCSQKTKHEFYRKRLSLILDT
jgi:hypothetical protein